MKTDCLSRRNFLCAGAVAGVGLALSPPPADAAVFAGRNFVQQANHLRLYMTHYALFEEPDPGITPAIYIDAATGLPTTELILIPPCESFGFTLTGSNPSNYAATFSAPAKQLPYGVSPPGFPPTPAPAAVIGAIQQTLLGTVSASVIAANTSILLVAIGNFVPSAQPIQATLAGSQFAVTRDVEFQVKVRVGFLFTPPAGLFVPPIGILTGWLTHGLVDQLIGAAPGADANDVVVYDWKAAMTLSTANSYVRQVANEPPPVADPFPQGLGAIQFIGSPVDAIGRYTIVGSASQVLFEAPPELLQFLFGTTTLTGVEFAIEESGVLIPA